MKTENLEKNMKKKYWQELFETYFPYFITAIISLSIADALVLILRPSMLPQISTNKRQARTLDLKKENISSYRSILSKNMFSLDGNIPESLFDKESRNKKNEEQIPIPSNLPLNLIGTIVHSNSTKSVATIELKGKNQTLAFRPGYEIENLANLVKVERNKVIIKNLNNGKMEFLEVKLNKNLTFKGSLTPPIKTKIKGDVEEIGVNQFQVKRNDLMKYINNLNAILNDARSEPHLDPSTGKIDGFTITDFKPGSFYEHLGIQKNDTLKEVNGENIDSAQKGLELYNQFKNNDHISLKVERNGQLETIDFFIR